jgi:release factor glutamine methyltransferase
MAVPCAETRRVDEALRWGITQLAGTDEPLLSARMLLAHVLGCSTTDLFVHPERTLDACERASYEALIARRRQHEPVAYLVGHRVFMDLDLQVDERVLIPRPETEHLVESAIAVAQRWPRPRVADIGTGSGAIAIAVARHLPEAQIWAVDVSPGAIEIARSNARRLGVLDRITFLTGDLLAPLPGPVDVIVANLPYVSKAEYASLPAGIRRYEPRDALLAGHDGLSAIRALLRMASAYLAEAGIILLEIGAAQGDAATELARAAFPSAAISLLSDLAGHDRVLRVERSHAEVHTPERTR